MWQPVAPADRDWLTRQDLPADPRPIDALLEDVRTHVMPYPMGNGHPRFFGWVNSPPSSAGVAVAPYAAALNPSCAGGDHAGVLLEHTVVRWLADLLGFPHAAGGGLPRAGGGGLLTSGASMATIVALAAARHRRDPAVRVHGMSRPMTVYVSAEGHSCLHKAAELLGLGSANVRVVPVDADHRMDVRALRAMLADDDAAFCVAGSAGTVNTGAVDPLDDIADVAAEHDLWFHVDGAYGAFGILGPDPAPGYAGMHRADSLAIDPHKWLGVPVDCGCLLLRDPTTARDAFSLVPAYLRDESAGDFGWFSEYGIEQTRPFRALRAWATLSHLGRTGVVQLIAHTVGLAHTLAAMVTAADDFELLTPVVNSITAFRYKPAGVPLAHLNQLNQPIPATVQRRGRAFLTGTRLAGVEALRACILSPATTTSDLTVLLDEIRAAANLSPKGSQPLSQGASGPGEEHGCA